MKLLEELRRRAVTGLYGRVLEIGAGSGANFPYYRTAAQVVAVEPNPTFRQNAIAAAHSVPVAIKVVDARAEQLPFASHSFDAAVVTLVLCSVDDVTQSLAELRRVLRPGAPVHFVEHVCSEDKLVFAIQRVLTRLVRRFGGCHLDRRTEQAIAEAGFQIEERHTHWEELLLELYARTPVSHDSAHRHSARPAVHVIWDGGAAESPGISGAEADGAVSGRLRASRSPRAVRHSVHSR